MLTYCGDHSATYIHISHHYVICSGLEQCYMSLINKTGQANRNNTTPWAVAYHVSPSMGFSRQEYWSELPFPSPGDLPDLGIEPGSPALYADALTSEPPGKMIIVYYPFNVSLNSVC